MKIILDRILSCTIISIEVFELVFGGRFQCIRGVGMMVKGDKNIKS